MIVQLQKPNMNLPNGSLNHFLLLSLSDRTSSDMTQKPFRKVFYNLPLFFFCCFLWIDKSYPSASLETAINRCLDKHSVRDWAHWRWSENTKWKDTLEGHTAHISRNYMKLKPRNEMLVKETNIEITLFFPS